VVKCNLHYCNIVYIYYVYVGDFEKFINRRTVIKKAAF
jgi:hypothetical protein